jgi:hypothetical protein
MDALRDRARVGHQCETGWHPNPAQSVDVDCIWEDLGMGLWNNNVCCLFVQFWLLPKKKNENNLVFCLNFIYRMCECVGVCSDVVCCILCYFDCLINVAYKTHRFTGNKYIYLHTKRSLFGTFEISHTKVFYTAKDTHYHYIPVLNFQFFMYLTLRL